MLGARAPALRGASPSWKPDPGGDPCVDPGGDPAARLWGGSGAPTPAGAGDVMANRGAAACAGAGAGAGRATTAAVGRPRRAIAGTGAGDGGGGGGGRMALARWSGMHCVPASTYPGAQCSQAPPMYLHGVHATSERCGRYASKLSIKWNTTVELTMKGMLLQVRVPPKILAGQQHQGCICNAETSVAGQL